MYRGKLIAAVESCPYDTSPLGFILVRRYGSRQCRLRTRVPGGSKIAIDHSDREFRMPKPLAKREALARLLTKLAPPQIRKLHKYPQSRTSLFRFERVEIAVFIRANWRGDLPGILF